MRRALIAATTTAVLAATVAPAALAADAATTAVIHRESVLTELEPSGAPGTSRVFTQLTVPGGQQVNLTGQSTTGLRSLSGDASRSGDAVVFGPGLSRTVADHTADLPVEVEVTYTIDGRTVEPRDVVGHDGEVAISYVVRNLTATPTELTVADGDRVATEQTVDVAVPFVGSLSMTLPPAFSGVQAPGAVVVGDGRGNTVVTWSLLLFSPLGSEVQEVTLTATARDAVVPPALLQVIPVSPSSFGSFDSTAAAYEGAVDSTRELTSGAREIDRNLKLLVDGASKLLAGLTQLRDGSDRLATGLGDARDGAARLSDGLGTARAGGGELADGLGDLSDGANRVADGLAALDAGGTRLLDGLGRLATGSDDLADGVGELAAGATLVDDNTAALAAGATSLAGGATQLEAGIKELSAALQGSDGLPSAIAGIDQLQAGIGSGTTPDTVLYGLALVGAGLTEARAGIDGAATASEPTLRSGVARIQGGLSNPQCNAADPANAANPCGVAQLSGSITGLSTALLADLQTAIASLTAIDETVLSAGDQTLLADTIGVLSTNATRAGTIRATAAGIDTVVAQLQAGLGLVDAGLVDLAAGIGDPATADTLRNGVARVTAGVSNPACDLANPTNAANPCGVLQGLQALELGLTSAAADVAAGLGAADQPNTLLWGAAQVAGGSTQVAGGASRLQAEGTAVLAAGAARAAAGAGQLADGAASAADGAGDLSDGAGQLADGSRELADGAQRAAGGSDDLVEGLVQLDDGGQQLADGLEDAVDGGLQLADGLGRAVPGGTQIADGAQRLTDEGTSVLARSVSDASASSSLQLRHLRAVAARGSDGDGLPYPTVEGAEATAIYRFELAGVGADIGPGAVGRVGLGALALLAAALLGAVAGGRTQGRRGEGDAVAEREPVSV